MEKSLFETYLEAVKNHEQLKLFYVNVPCNVYSGKYYDYGAWNVAVEADSEKEALSIIKDPKNKQSILEYLNTARLTGGKRIISLEDYKKGAIWPEKASVAKPLEYAGVKSKYISKSGEFIKQR